MGRVRIFEAGERYGRLTVAERRDTKGPVTCVCDCGTRVQFALPKVLVTGHTKSCGCLQVENRRRRCTLDQPRLTPGGCADCGTEVLNFKARGSVALRCPEHAQEHRAALRRARMRACYAADREKFAAEARQRRATDGGRHAQLAKARRDADPERHRELALARYHRDCKAAAAKRRAHNLANPDRSREVARRAHARRMQRDPEQIRAWSRNRRAAELNADGYCTPADWREVLAIYGEECLRCGSVDNITQDHVVPLMLGGAHWPWNLQPLCRSCNSAKGARDAYDYRPDLGAAIARHPAPHLIHTRRVPVLAIARVIEASYVPLESGEAVPTEFDFAAANRWIAEVHRKHWKWA